MQFVQNCQIINLLNDTETFSHYNKSTNEILESVFNYRQEEQA